MPWHDRILVIAPHADDETLGCGGMISTMLERTATVQVLILSLGKTPKGKNEQTMCELQAAMNALHVADFSVAFPGKQGQLDALPQSALVTALDDAIGAFRPSAVFLPYASHHQDHEATYRAALASLRPHESTVGIRLVALYEYPYAAAWPPPLLPGGKFHLPLAPRDLDRKMEALACYQTQFARDTWLTLERAKQWSQMRGAEIGVEAAEAFWAIRGVL